jgi:hypothetical protein
VPYLFEVPLDGAGPMIVEVAQYDDGPVRVAGTGEVAGRAKESLHAALERIRPMAKAFADQTVKGPDGADEVCVEFGLKLTAESGFVVSRATTEANFRVGLVWRRS